MVRAVAATEVVARLHPVELVAEDGDQQILLAQVAQAEVRLEGAGAPLGDDPRVVLAARLQQHEARVEAARAGRVHREVGRGEWTVALEEAQHRVGGEEGVAVKPQHASKLQQLPRPQLLKGVEPVRRVRIP